MKKVLFLSSHLGSESDQLYVAFCDLLSIQGYIKENVYKSMQDIYFLTERKHKLKTSARIYMDHLLFNYQFSCKQAYENCKFIFIVREPEETIEFLVSNKLYNKKDAISYYLYRIRRICEMAKNAKEGLFLTHTNLKNGKGIQEIKDYLNIKERFNFVFENIENKNKNILTYKEIENLNQVYEKYLYFVHNINCISIK